MFWICLNLYSSSFIIKRIQFNYTNFVRVLLTLRVFFIIDTRLLFGKSKVMHHSILILFKKNINVVWKFLTVGSPPPLNWYHKATGPCGTRLMHRLIGDLRPQVEKVTYVLPAIGRINHSHNETLQGFFPK